MEVAFTTMINKLIFGHKSVLRPLLDNLRGANDTDNYRRIKELEMRMEAILERSQVLTGLMTKGTWSRLFLIRKGMNWRQNLIVCR